MCVWKFFSTWVLDGVVLCLHSSTIVTSSCVHSDVFSEEGGVDLKLAIPIKLRIILLQKLHGLIITIVVEWKLTTFLHQEPWLDALPRTRGVAPLRPEQRATPLVHGGTSNHGSWHKNVVNSYIQQRSAALMGRETVYSRVVLWHLLAFQGLCDSKTCVTRWVIAWDWCDVWPRYRRKTSY